MLETILPKLLEYGWPGVLIAILLYVLYNKEKENQRCRERVDELHELRVQEAMKSVAALEESARVAEAASIALGRVTYLLDNQGRRART